MIFSTNKSNLIGIDTAVLFAAVCLILTIIFFIIVTKKFKRNRKKVMGIWILALLSFAIILFISGKFGRLVDVQTINNKTYTRNELTQDLNQLEKYIENENPFYFTDKDKFNQALSTAYENIKDGMTELEFYRLINPIVTAVGCGHTTLSVSEALVMNRKDTAKFFPLEVTLVNSKLYVLEDDLENGISAGTEIVSINRKTSEDIINVLLENISSDSYNEAKPRYIISKHFNNKFYDFVDTSENFNVVLRNATGATRSVNLQAKYNEKYNTSAWALHSTQYQDGNYYDSKIYDDYALLTVKVFFKEKDNAFDTYLDKFFMELKEKNISKLIIDVRGNYGGNPDMAQALLSHLTKDKIDYFDQGLPFPLNFIYKKTVSPSNTTFDGNVAVLTDGACFSTNGHFCSLVKYHKFGTLVGSETGATYVCTDSSKNAILNHTRIRLHYSTKPFKVAVKGLSQAKGIQPDIPVPSTIEDILENRDVTMQVGLKALGIE